MDSCHRVNNTHQPTGRTRTCRKNCLPGTRYDPATNTCGCTNPGMSPNRLWPYNSNGVVGCRCPWGKVPNGGHTACTNRCEYGYRFFMNKSLKPRCCPIGKIVRGPQGQNSTGQVCCNPKPSSNSRWDASDSCSWSCISKPSNSSYMAGSCRWSCNSSYTRSGNRCCPNTCSNGYASYGSCTCRQVVTPTTCPTNRPCGSPPNCDAKLSCPDGVTMVCNTADCPTVPPCSGSLIRCANSCVTGKLCPGSSEKVCPSVSCSTSTPTPTGEVELATPATCE